MTGLKRLLAPECPCLSCRLGPAADADERGVSMVAMVAADIAWTLAKLALAGLALVGLVALVRAVAS